jgi:hypothetical protein
MQISKFNPQVSVEQFQKLIQTPTSTEEEIKNAAFAALAKSSVDALTKGLSSDIVSKVQGYAQERTDKILECVRKLNAFGDMRDDLLKIHDFKESKEIRKKVKEAYFMLQDYDPDFIKQFKEKDPLSKHLPEFKRINYECCMQHPLEGIKHALSEFKKPSKDEAETNCKIEVLCREIQWGFEFDASEDWKKKINFSDYPSFVLEIFVKQLPIAKEKALEAQTKREVARREKIETSKKQLPASLSIYQEVQKKLDTNENYQKYLQLKQEIDVMMKQLKMFCTTNEVINHAKINRDSVTRFHRKFSKLD